MQELTLKFETPEQRASFVQYLRDNEQAYNNDERTKTNTIDFNLDYGSIIFTNQPLAQADGDQTDGDQELGNVDSVVESNYTDPQGLSEEERSETSSVEAEPETTENKEK